MSITVDGAIASAIRGKCGQAFLRDMIRALDSMEDKALIDRVLTNGIRYCAIGAVLKFRGCDFDALYEASAADLIARMLGIAPILVTEITRQNDRAAAWPCLWELSTARWTRMRLWALAHLEDEKGIEPSEEPKTI